MKIKTLLKNILKALHLYMPIVNWHNRNIRKKHHHLKKQIPVLNFKRRYPYNIFIETGTFQGEMVEAMRRRFKKIYSIELARSLYDKAREKFAKYPHINLLYGDSAVELPKILKDINEPAIFWLDAHYSGGETARGGTNTPIESELCSIFSHPIKNHVILIDDAGDFDPKYEYPTATAVKELAGKNNYSCEIADNIFRIYPKI